MHSSALRCFILLFFFSIKWLQSEYDLSHNVEFRLSTLEKSPHLSKIVVFLVKKFRQSCAQQPFPRHTGVGLAPVADLWLLTVKTPQ